MGVRTQLSIGRHRAAQVSRASPFHVIIAFKTVAGAASYPFGVAFEQPIRHPMFCLWRNDLSGGGDPKRPGVPFVFVSGFESLSIDIRFSEVRVLRKPIETNRTSGFPSIRLSDKTSSLPSREAMSFRLRFYESKRVVEVLVREACCSRAINLVLLT
jgi:hypothetical protein